MTPRFAGRVVLVTGGGSGIGRHAARAFAREGATVVVGGRSEASLRETVELIVGEGGTASAVIADVTRSQEVARLIAVAVERHGALHVAVNNAGMRGVVAPAAELDDDGWREVIETNLTGLWLSMKHEIAHMRTHGGGTIVNISSNVGAHLRVPGLGAYAAAKAGVSALTRTAAREYIGNGIRINAVSPGPSDTAMSLRSGESAADRAARLSKTSPIGRVGLLDEIVSAILWLASPESSYVVGHDLVIDGGASA
jgi:NAD(P)-dependent dehydrogenase (short-subunit alcohol dehydrogenase family)